MNAKEKMPWLHYDRQKILSSEIRWKEKLAPLSDGQTRRNCIRKKKKNYLKNEEVLL